MDLPFLLIAAIVFFAFMTQAATGFGAMLIAMTLGALLYPVPLLLSWFVPLVAVLSLYLLWRDRAHIDAPLLFKLILPAMAVGLVAGQYLFYSIDSLWLKRALGLLVLLVALRAIWHGYLLQKHAAANSANNTTVAKKPSVPLWSAAAGVVHGALATGGPLLVYTLNAQNLNKSTFRATLSSIWLVMALLLIASYIASGSLTVNTLPQIGWLLLVLPLSTVAGEKLHKRIDPQGFTRAVNIMLIVSGFALMVS